MRVMVLVPGDENTEAGQMPDEKELTEMGNFNEELVNAGVMLAGEGLHPTSRGKRVRFTGDKRTVIDGPFPETKEQLGGFWIVDVADLDAAMAWATKASAACRGPVEVRPFQEEPEA